MYNKNRLLKKFNQTKKEENQSYEKKKQKLCNPWSCTHTHTHTHTGSFRGYLEWNKKEKENIKTHELYVVFLISKMHYSNLQKKQNIK